MSRTRKAIMVGVIAVGVAATGCAQASAATPQRDQPVDSGLYEFFDAIPVLSELMDHNPEHRPETGVRA